MKRPLLESLIAQVFVLLVGAWSPRIAHGQGLPAPGPGGPTMTPADSGNMIAPAIVLAVVLLGALILGVVFLDLSRKRRAQAIAIEGQIADALMREPRLGRAVITAEAHLPLTGRSGPRVEVRGEVEYPELREVAVRIVRQELLRYHPESIVEDRIFVAPPVPAGRP